MKKIILLIFLLVSVSIIWGQDIEYKFRLTLSDKGRAGFSIDKPGMFLSRKAVERRVKQNVKVDETDLPVSQEYLRLIEAAGCKVVTCSKWLNTVCVNCEDSLSVCKLEALPFVASVKFVWKGLNEPEKTMPKDTLAPYYPISENTLDEQYYGQGLKNTVLENGDKLHRIGYKGKGIDIAVIDAGFNNLPYIEFLDNINVIGYKSFIYDKKNLFRNTNEHGLNVLSCMAANKPYRFVGTAPEANYLLLMCEDSRSEYPVEEDYVVAALEYADSAGMDIVNISLGYHRFDAPSDSMSHDMLDGRTLFVSRAVTNAVRKGMFLVCSAGNEGDKPWGKLTPPADAKGVLTVGAMDRDSVVVPFSSRGYSADLRIKPDIVALGKYVSLINRKGKMAIKSGTSFASPIMCGLVACLWQAYPGLTNKELLEIIRQSADAYDNPDQSYGYGVPDMGKAMKLAEKRILEDKSRRIGFKDKLRTGTDGSAN